MSATEEVTFIDLSEDDADAAIANKQTQILISPSSSRADNMDNNNFAKPLATMAARKQLVPSSWEANELSKPLSPYARFFQDTASAIKQQNPNCSYNEVRQIVLNMWEVLDPERKKLYMLDNIDNSTTTLNIVDNANEADASSLAATQIISPQSVTIEKLTPNKAVETKTTADLSNDLTGTSPTSNSIMNANNSGAPKATNVYKPKFVSSNQAENNVNTNNNQKLQTCIRAGCNNQAIVSPDWEDEYCSSSCVVLHCRNVFSTWTAECKKEHEARNGT